MRDSIDLRLINYIKLLGYNCVMISSNSFAKKNKSFKEISNFLKKINVDFFILSGGEDIGKNKNRDQLENQLLKFAKKNKKKVLGICRGMQIIVNNFGIKNKKCKNHVNRYHKIYGELNQKVLCYHNYQISNIPKEFKVISESADGVIEGIYSKKLNWLGIMFHPEREKKTNRTIVKFLKNKLKI